MSNRETLAISPAFSISWRFQDEALELQSLQCWHNPGCGCWRDGFCLSGFPRDRESLIEGWMGYYRNVLMKSADERRFRFGYGEENESLSLRLLWAIEIT